MTAPIQSDAIIYFKREIETASRDELEVVQLERVGHLLGLVLERNPFYRRKLNEAGVGSAAEIRSWDDFRRLPFTTKGELVQDQTEHPPFGTNLTYPLDEYVKLHQTSGTSGGRPLRVLDTQESWGWWADLWGYVYRGAGIGPGDRVFFAFSFGPFIGFWAAYEGARRVGALAIPGGGLTSEQRLSTMFDNGATTLCCTPTYALRLIEVAREIGIDLAGSAIRATVHAGEPGASIPATRSKIEDAYGAKCYDHTGLTEVGGTGFTCQHQTGIHLTESEFIFEVLDPNGDRPVEPGEQGEIVVTNLGRLGTPVIRYRTGDLARVTTDPCSCGRTFARMLGGILGRADDMVTVRGVNVFPSSIEDIVREFSEVEEFRIELLRRREMEELRVEVEVDVAAMADGEREALRERIGNEINRRLLLRVALECVPHGTLPRFELKAKRFFRREE